MTRAPKREGGASGSSSFGLMVMAPVLVMRMVKLMVAPALKGFTPLSCLLTATVGTSAKTVT